MDYMNLVYVLNIHFMRIVRIAETTAAKNISEAITSSAKQSHVSLDSTFKTLQRTFVSRDTSHERAADARNETHPSFMVAPLLGFRKVHVNLLLQLWGELDVTLGSDVPSSLDSSPVVVLYQEIKHFGIEGVIRCHLRIRRSHRVDLTGIL